MRELSSKMTEGVAPSTVNGPPLSKREARVRKQEKNGPIERSVFL